MSTPTTLDAAQARDPRSRILGLISLCHCLNDMMQSLILASYPLLKQNHGLSFTQIGLLTLTYQCTSSLLQPLVGLYTDRKPQPRSLAAAMAFTLLGLLLLSQAEQFPALLCAAALVGMGSSIFHPEASRVARMAAAGGKAGFAQSLFQVGGNAGSALGPLLAATVVYPHGQTSLAAFSAVALVAMVLLNQVSHWYASHPRRHGQRPPVEHGYSRAKVALILGILLLLVFSKYFYMASMTSYYTFYLMSRFALDVQTAQMLLFVFMFAVALGALLGGPLGDRIGRRQVIWFSILGAAPFTLLLPHANLAGTVALSFGAGMILASAFSSIVVYAQELLPGRVGMVSGLMFGFAFGVGGIGAGALGQLADHYGVEAVYQWCAWLPLLGVCAMWLPDVRHERA